MLPVKQEHCPLETLIIYTSLYLLPPQAPFFLLAIKFVCAFFMADAHKIFEQNLCSPGEICVVGICVSLKQNVCLGQVGARAPRVARAAAEPRAHRRTRARRTAVFCARFCALGMLAYNTRSVNAACAPSSREITCHL